MSVRSWYTAHEVTMPNGIEAPVTILGRILLAAIFVVSPIVNLVPNFSTTVDAMRKAGVPIPTIALAIAILFLSLGSLSLISGYKGRWGALLLLLFLVPATLYFHAPWAAPDAAAAGQQAIHFLKNIGLMGAMILIIILGTGPGSIDGANQ